mmetsp:Transcript_45673/g.145810  ORF Transcript_45673/g.145810 Transcript_45673/m.145810 type:complete len:327 (+) Transcript_45673:462-1442(+)
MAWVPASAAAPGPATGPALPGTRLRSPRRKSAPARASAAGRSSRRPSSNALRYSAAGPAVGRSSLPWLRKCSCASNAKSGQPDHTTKLQGMSRSTVSNGACTEGAPCNECCASTARTASTDMDSRPMPHSLTKPCTPCNRCTALSRRPRSCTVSKGATPALQEPSCCAAITLTSCHSARCAYWHINSGKASWAALVSRMWVGATPGRSEGAATGIVVTPLAAPGDVRSSGRGSAAHGRPERLAGAAGSAPAPMPGPPPRPGGAPAVRGLPAAGTAPWPKDSADSGGGGTRTGGGHGSPPTGALALPLPARLEGAFCAPRGDGGTTM